MNNYYNFTFSGGFPFDQGVLDDLQSGILEAEGSLANLLGPLAIVSGCTISGSTAANGVVAINGVIMPFVGGTVGSNVIVVSSDTEFTYQSGIPDAHAALITQYATFGDDGVQFNAWANFVSNTTDGILARLNRLEAMAAPFIPGSGSAGGGGMVLWNKPVSVPLPTGWHEVVDWRGRLPFGYDPTDSVLNDVAINGGNRMHTNTIDEMAAHTHTYTETVGGLDFGSGSTRDSNTAATGGTTGSTGNGTPWDMLNPVRTVMFIEYTGV
jgi:hypothetical protein